VEHRDQVPRQFFQNMRDAQEPGSAIARLVAQIFPRPPSRSGARGKDVDGRVRPAMTWRENAEPRARKQPDRRTIRPGRLNTIDEN
jgi:hypothetical protein